MSGFTRRRTVKSEDRDQLAKFRKLEAINAELAQHKRIARITRLLIVVLSVVILAVLLYLLLGRV